ncbi:hypothetical protein [Labedella endophytica]|uniref:SDR family NAD(P)-dependent oxidoreductase n=1 Tax=Labedella endophytica TaxID=1523160 RepID=A0A433JNW8_9MICO|nr:hypothetical protein [Labedella endophytica]RUQ98155.1 hypothetical protein ELQ94_14120 [Labedella endophytica]
MTSKRTENGTTTRRAVVTGGTGGLGFHVARRLHEHGFDVTSSAITTATIDGAPRYDDVDEAGEYAGMAVMGRAKLAHLAYNQDLARELGPSGITVLAVDPSFHGRSGLLLGPDGTPSRDLLHVLTPEIAASVRSLTKRVLASTA